MEYTKTKIDTKCKDILKDIYHKLEEITIPTSFRETGYGSHHARKTGGVSQHTARQTLYGIINGKKTKLMIKYPELMELFIKFIANHYPTFKFNSVYINKNVVCKRHLDSKNVGNSLLVGLGQYTAGRTILYINNNERKFHIKSQSLLFNGSKIEHSSENFNGNRYSLVFFNTKYST
jgi:hypothetical protein